MYVGEHPSIESDCKVSFKDIRIPTHDFDTTEIIKCGVSLLYCIVMYCIVLLESDPYIMS